VDGVAGALAALGEAVGRGEPFHLVLTDALMPDVDGFALAREIARNTQLATTRVILLTSAGLALPKARAGTATFAATLTKPVKQSDLLDAIVTTFGAHETRAPVSRSPRRTRRAKTPGLRSRRVLVAEDNATNQKLVRALLKQRGYHVVVVGNGRRAVDISAAEPFDVILMDVQMPELGGFEATAAIRERERDTGGHVPIIALTAHAMSGDRERCLAAGMDAYVSKPLRPPELFAAIDSLLVPSGGSEGSNVIDSTPDLPRKTDWAALVASFGGKASLVEDVVNVFLTDAPATLERLRCAVRSGDASGVAAAAHAIKGAAGLFSQGEAFECARRLERLARAGDLTSIETTCTQLESAVSRLTEELRRLIQRSD
jgi:CheY-like chemotaxis protein